MRIVSHVNGLCPGGATLPRVRNKAFVFFFCLLLYASLNCR